MKPTLAILTFTWIIIAIGWFCPNLFKIGGAALYALGEACESIRSTFKSRNRVYRSKGLHVAQKPVTPLESILTPVQQEVVSALVNQGEKKSSAVAKMARAAAQLPSDASFEELWRKAVAA